MKTIEEWMEEGYDRETAEVLAHTAASSSKKAARPSRSVSPKKSGEGNAITALRPSRETTASGSNGV
jgi:hypothetical protein